MSLVLLFVVSVVASQPHVALSYQASQIHPHGAVVKVAGRKIAAESEICNNLRFNQECAQYPGKFVLYVTVNHDMVDFYQQWLAYASRFLDKQCMHLVAFAEDLQARSALTRLNDQSNFSVEVKMAIDVQRKSESLLRSNLPYGSKGYFNLVQRRPFYLRDFLQSNCTTVYADIDTIWKKNPFAEIISKNQGQDNFYVSDDSYYELEHPYAPRSLLYSQVCTCFMYVNPTCESRKLVNDWIQAMGPRSNVTDQEVFNLVLLQNNSRFKQVVSILPYEQFPPGSTYQKYQKTACIAHANWMVGHKDKADFLSAVAKDIHLQLK